MAQVEALLERLQAEAETRGEGWLQERQTAALGEGSAQRGGSPRELCGPSRAQQQLGSPLRASASPLAKRSAVRAAGGPGRHPHHGRSLASGASGSLGAPTRPNTQREAEDAGSAPGGSGAELG